MPHFRQILSKLFLSQSEKIDILIVPIMIIYYISKSSVNCMSAVYRNYQDINSWWRGDGVCSDAGWRIEREIKREKQLGEVIIFITIYIKTRRGGVQGQG